MKNIFYTYIYLDPRKKGPFTYGEYTFEYEPFYVGKGRYNQHLSHLEEVKYQFKKGNQLKLNKIRKIWIDIGLKPIIIKYNINMTEKMAFQLEKDLIQKIGRIDLEIGPLTNLTNGGDGVSGYVWSDDQLEKMRKRMLGNKNPMKNPEVSKKFLGENNPSKKESFKSRMKIVKSKKWKIITPTENNIIIYNLSDFCKNNNLDRESMYNTANGTQKSYKGWKCIRLNKKYTYKKDAFNSLRGNNSTSKRKDVREKISNSLKGHNHSKTKTYKITYPNGKQEIINNLAKFCRNNNLSCDCMFHVIGGTCKQHKGFKCNRI